MKKCHVVFSNVLSFMSTPDVENRCGLESNNQKMNLALKAKSAIMKAQICITSSHAALPLFFFSSLSYVFIYPVMWVPAQRRPKNSGSLEHLAPMEKGLCRLTQRELKSGLNVSSCQWNVAARWQQESLQGTLSFIKRMHQHFANDSSLWKDTFCQLISYRY